MSNYGTISVAPSGTMCSLPDAFSAAPLTTALQSGDVSIGSLTYSIVQNDSPAAAIAQAVQQLGLQPRLELLDFDFTRFNGSFGLTTPPREAFPRNSCNVFAFSGDTADFVEVVNITGLDAGASITVNGPNGTRTAPQRERGDYPLDLTTSSIPGFPDGIPGVGQAQPYLTPGSYTFSGPGGADVGPFSTTRTITDGVEWTNKNQVQTINRSQGVTVTWTGGQPSEEDVWIFGSSFRSPSFGAPAQTVGESFIGAAFFCQVDAGRGSYTVGPEVLLSLPPSQTIAFPPFGSFSTGTLQVGAFGRVRPFSASGLTFGYTSGTIVDASGPAYQ